MQAMQPSPVSNLAPARRASLMLGVAFGLIAALLVAAVLLWATHGSTIFFDLVAAGVAACF